MAKMFEQEDLVRIEVSSVYLLPLLHWLILDEHLSIVYAPCQMQPIVAQPLICKNNPLFRTFASCLTATYFDDTLSITSL